MSRDDSVPQEIIDLVQSLRDLQKEAARQYRPVVNDIVRTGSRDVEHLEHTLDRLLDFCGEESVLAMYKQLCRHYWKIDPAATAHYIQAYRERWDADDQQNECD